jgi:hypothetical protein
LIYLSNRYYSYLFNFDGNNSEIVLMRILYSLPLNTSNIDVSSLTNNSTVFFIDDDINSIVPVKVIKVASPQNVVINSNVTLVNASSSLTYLFFEADPSLYSINSESSIYSMTFKVFTNDNVMLSNPNSSMLINIPNNNYKTIEFIKNGTNTVVATGIRSTNTDPFSVTITQNMLGNAIGILTFNSSSIGSDPHVYTIGGHKYDLKNPSSRKWYDLLSFGDLQVKGHFSGFNKGIFFDSLKIMKNKENVMVNFNKKSLVSSSNKLFHVNKNFNTINYINNTSDKSKGKLLSKSSFLHNIGIYDSIYPLDISLDFETRYVHFKFNKNIPKDMNGILS